MFGKNVRLFSFISRSIRAFMRNDVKIFFSRLILESIEKIFILSCIFILPCKVFRYCCCAFQQRVGNINMQCKEEYSV